MKTRFESNDLERLLEKFPLTAAGLKYLAQSMAEPPRVVRTRARSKTILFKSPKTMRMVAAESRVEANALIVPDLDDDTLFFVVQPAPLFVAYEKNGRRTTAVIHPDTLIGSRSKGFVLEDIQSRSATAQLDVDTRFRLNNDGKIVSPPAEAAALMLGMTYVIRIEPDQAWMHLRNRAPRLDGGA